MLKTASQIADEVLEKVAVSPDLALRVLKNRARGLASDALKMGDKGPYYLLEPMTKANPRTMRRAAELFKGKGGSDNLWNRLEGRLDKVLDRADMSRYARTPKVKTPEPRLQRQYDREMKEIFRQQEERAARYRAKHGE